MNAKLAVAISLGASSLALFGMAGVANAETVTPPNSGTNPQPVVQPSTDNPVEKGKGEAQQAINDANTQKEAINTEVNKAESEATDANTDATNANNEVIKAQTELDNKHKEAQTAEEEKGKADKELADQKAAVDKADKDVEAKQTVLNQEKEKQTAAENKLKATQDEKGKATTDLGTAEKEVQTKTTEQTQAGKNVETETGNLQTANTQLEKAKKDKQDAQAEANQLSDVATQKENEHKAAEQKVKENTQQQEKIQKEIDNLNAAGSGTTNAEVQELEKKANAAKQAYDSAQNEANTKAQDAQKAADDIKTKHTALINAEGALKDKNSDYAGLIEKVTSAEGEAATKAAAYDAADKNAPKDNDSVEKKSDFYKFLQYVINTENAKGENKNADLITDAENAQKVLKGQTYTIPGKNKTVGNVTYTTPGYTAEAPTWYNDLVKPGLGRVGSADSLENMKQAATYYAALDKYRKDDVSSMKTVKVRLTLIAESIVHSFYSAAVMNHAAFHDATKGADSSKEELNTHPYIHSAENLAWDADYNNYDPTRKKQDLGQCNTDSGHLSCSYDSNEKHNAVDGWYDLEKTIYDNTIQNGKWKLRNIDYTLTTEGLNVLKDHRTDFGHYFYEHPGTKLFNDDTDGHVTNVFRSAVGHYTNFSEDNNFASGFAKADISYEKRDKKDIYQDIAVWHGSSESSISIEEYKKLLEDYADTIKSSTPALSENEAENLRHLNADANSANMAVFDAKYDALKAKSAMAEQDRKAIEALENKITEASKNFEQAKSDTTAANEASTKAAKKAEELKNAWNTAKNAYEAAKQKAQEDTQLGEEARNKKIQQLQTELQKLQAKAQELSNTAAQTKTATETARTTAEAKKTEIKTTLTKAITDAEATVKSAKESVATAEAAKNKADQELKEAQDKVTTLTQKISELDSKIKAETQKVTEAKSEVQVAQTALQGAQTTQSTATDQLKALQTKARNAAQKVETEKQLLKTQRKLLLRRLNLLRLL